MPQVPPTDVGAHVSFEWLPGGGFLVERWEGTFSPDGNTITGRWERRADGADWEHDFDLRYQRIS